MRIRLILTLLLAATLPGCARKSSGRPPTKPSVATTPAQAVPSSGYTLTWRNYNGLDDDPADAVYILDGERIGVGLEGMRKLREIPIRKGVTITVLLPWRREASGPDYMPPYFAESGLNLEDLWREKGARIVHVEVGAKKQP